MASKHVITADDVRAARKTGRDGITVPFGALLTPLARDEARELGIRLVFSEPAPREEDMKQALPRFQVSSLPFPDAAISGPEAAIVPGQITLCAGQPLEKALIPASPAEFAPGGRRGKSENEKNARRADCRMGVCMIFLTEDDIRQRSIAEGGELVLSASEQLTPSAREYIHWQRLRVVVAQDGAGHQCGEEMEADNARTGAECAELGLTHLDAATRVAKTHPRIEARGKLDSLMAEIVLTQTLFDPEAKLPELLKECLADLKEWVFQTLAAEISGSILPAQSMAGLGSEVLRTVSRNPRRYLGTDHLTPDAALGVNMAFLNRLRAQVRETELAAARAALCREDIQESLNRLSSAVYVLMLFTRLAENGDKLPDTALLQ
jgi:ethanolamine utilization cobalamin adenosyltransferase